MKTSREAKRFQCPCCKKPIQLIEVDPKARRISSCDLIAICRKCDRVYTAEDWRRRHGGASKRPMPNGPGW